MSPCFLTHIVEGSGNWTQRYPNYLLVSALTRYRRLSLKLCRPSPGAGVQWIAVCRGQAVGRGPPPSKLYRGVSIALCSSGDLRPRNRCRQSILQRLKSTSDIRTNLGTFHTQRRRPPSLSASSGGAPPCLSTVIRSLASACILTRCRLLFSFLFLCSFCCACSYYIFNMKLRSLRFHSPRLCRIAVFFMKP